MATTVVEPVRLMIKLDRPFLFLDYKIPGGTLRRRSIPIRQLQNKSSIPATLDGIVNDIKVRHLRYLQSISTQQLKRLILKLAPTLVQQQQQQQPLQQSSGSNSAISNLAFASPLSGKTPVKKSQLPPLFNFGGPIVSEEKSINESPAAVAPQQANITVFNSGRGSFENYTVKDETMSAGDTESIPEDIIEVDDIETADVIADNNDHLDALW